MTFHAKTLGIKHTFEFDFEENQPNVPNPSYHFLSLRESIEFQNQVRGRRLLETFDTDSICIIGTGLRHTHTEYARMEPVKLWRRTDTAITFFQNLDVGSGNKTNFQFYLTWFRREAELRGERKLILKFNHQHDIEQQNAPPENPGFLLNYWALVAKPSNQEIVKLHERDLKTNDSVKNWQALEIKFTDEKG